jgi:hypothetical protein
MGGTWMYYWFGLPRSDLRDHSPTICRAPGRLGDGVGDAQPRFLIAVQHDDAKDQRFGNGDADLARLTLKILTRPLLRAMPTLRHVA